MFKFLLLGLFLTLGPSTFAATYYVDGEAANASDENPGTEPMPWKTISRAGAATELRPGDTVLIRSGVYREHVKVGVSGEPGRPITFAAAPGARVVIKGSEVVRGPWKRLREEANVKEPYPNAFARVWKIQLGDEFFTDPRFEHVYRDRARRWVSQVFIEDERPLQRIGPDPLYKNEPYTKITLVGRGLDDMIEDSFYFDAGTQTLYLKIGGEPSWYSIEVGVRGFTLTAEKIHDVIIRGLEMRQNRQPGGQWPMVAIGRCERVVLEKCKIFQADFCGLGLFRCRECVVRDCDLSYNGNSGFGMGECEDCVIEDSRLLFNNYRRFHAGWHTGGMKCIPKNKRCTVQRCEAAYNIAAPGIWFDSENSDIRILSNVCHHNNCGIFFEINKGGGVIADNLVYANQGRGIYISGSQKTWVVHNTVACNDGGIVCMPREGDWTLEDVRVLNNLLIRNYVTQDSITRGCDLTLFMGATEQAPFKRTVMSNHSDYNLFANTSWIPTMRHHWNPNNTLEHWQKRFGEDLHSRLAPLEFEQSGTAFKLITQTGLDVAGPLPPELGWRPEHPGRVGSARTHWP